MRFIRVPVLLACVVACIMGVATAQAGKATAPKVPKGWKFSFPDGDARTGGVLFLRMECYSCHTGGAAGVGPDLTGYSYLPKEYLAESIIKVHTVVAAPGYVVKKGKAGMGNYNHFLTVQELIDLVAFLKHVGETK